jgi:hypothetical protein
MVFDRRLAFGPMSGLVHDRSRDTVLAIASAVVPPRELTFHAAIPAMSGGSAERTVKSDLIGQGKCISASRPFWRRPEDIGRVLRSSQCTHLFQRIIPVFALDAHRYNVALRG